MMEVSWEWIAGVLLAGWGVLLTAVAALLVWSAKYQIARIDRVNSRLSQVEESKANKAATNKRFDDLLRALTDHVNDDRAMHGLMRDKMDETNKLLANVVGQLQFFTQQGKK